MEIFKYKVIKKDGTKITGKAWYVKRKSMVQVREERFKCE